MLRYNPSKATTQRFMSTSNPSPSDEQKPLESDVFEALPSEIRLFVREVIEQAKHKLERGDEVRTTIFLSSPEKGLTAVVLDTSSVQAKEASIAHARQLAAIHGSTMSVFISESWGLSASDAPKHEAILAKYGSLANYPGRIDVLYVHVETHNGIYAVQADIKPMPPSKKRRTVVFRNKFFMATEIGGRMAGVLPPPADKNAFH